MLRSRLQQQPGVPNLFPLAQQRRRDERAAQLHGRLVTRSRGRRGVRWARVNFKGAHARPGYFKLCYADGTVEDGVSHRLLTTGKGYKLKPLEEVPPAKVSVPPAEQIPVL